MLYNKSKKMLFLQRGNKKYGYYNFWNSCDLRMKKIYCISSGKVNKISRVAEKYRRIFDFLFCGLEKRLQSRLWFLGSQPASSLTNLPILWRSSMMQPKMWRWRSVPSKWTWQFVPSLLYRNAVTHLKVTWSIPDNLRSSPVAAPPINQEPPV